MKIKNSVMVFLRFVSRKMKWYGFFFLVYGDLEKIYYIVVSSIENVNYLLNIFLCKIIYIELFYLI